VGELIIEGPPVTESNQHPSQELPEPFQLDAWGSAKPERFVRLFRRTWDNLIPHAARDVIRRLCQRSSDGFGNVQYTHDKVVLSGGPSGSADGQFCYSKYDNGCHFEFLACIVERIPDECVCTLVAHELAHCYLTAKSLEHLTRSTAEDEVAGLLVNDWNLSPGALDRMDEQTNVARALVAMIGLQQSPPG
jgi:hypothetical protein